MLKKKVPEENRCSEMLLMTKRSNCHRANKDKKPAVNTLVFAGFAD